jgi:ferredoxin
MKVRFLHADGDGETVVDAAAGENLLSAGQNALMPLEGTCEGQMACSTCHVIVDKAYFDKLPDASDMEEDMLDLAAGVRRTSRLACQITLTDDLDGLTVKIPSESRNMQTGR